jgi:hypothetical protein
MSCPGCGSPMLAVTRAGLPAVYAITALQEQRLLVQLSWLAQRQSKRGLLARPALLDELLPDVGSLLINGPAVIAARGPRVVKRKRVSLAGWSSYAGSYLALEAVYWARANQLLRTLPSAQRLGLRRAQRSGSFDELTPRALAYLVWRMSWEGRTDPRCLGRRFAPFFGLAGWLAMQPGEDEGEDADDISEHLANRCQQALTVSWRASQQIIRRSRRPAIMRGHREIASGHDTGDAGEPWSRLHDWLKNFDTYTITSPGIARY